MKVVELPGPGATFTVLSSVNSSDADLPGPKVLLGIRGGSGIPFVYLEDDLNNTVLPTSHAILRRLKARETVCHAMRDSVPERVDFHAKYSLSDRVSDAFLLVPKIAPGTLF